MTAKLIPWNSRTAEGGEIALGEAAFVAKPRAFEPIPDTVILIADEQLEALGTIFCSSPLRGSMTFEAYLFLKGYARRTSF